MKQLKYVILLVSILSILVGCNQQDHVKTYMDKIEETFLEEKSPPLKKKEFELYLNKGIQRNLYYSIRDELNAYIGEKVEYTAIGRYNDDMEQYDIVIYINPSLKSDLPSTHTTMALYDNKYDVRIAISRFGSNLKLNEYKSDDYYATTIELYREQNYKMWYQGKITIPEINKPESETFDEKESIINAIYEKIEEIIDGFGLVSATTVKVYIQDFNQHDAVISVLIMPDLQLSNGIEIIYNLVEGLEYPVEILYNKDLGLEDETIFERRNTLFNRIIDSAISSKEITVK